MTARQLYEALIIELNKEKAPSMLLEDFNYFANKAVNQYINKRYSTGYDINQQFTDDVRVLKSSQILYAEDVDLRNDVTSLQSYLKDAKYVFNLPQDYLHLLNCTCVYKINKRYKCYNAGTYWEVGATRLTADIAPVILHNFYMKPSYKKPYYYINNTNIDTEQWDETQELTPTNPIELNSNNISGTLQNNGTDRAELNTSRNIPAEAYLTNNYGEPLGPNETPQTIDISQAQRVGKDSNEFIDIKNQILPRFRKERDGRLDDTVERSAGNRYGNSSKVRLEIRYGRDNTVFQLVAVKIDYLKAPQHIRLTQEQIDLVEDTSQILEFPDYVCQEIVNELVKLVMENASDPRLNTNPLVSQSIASPAQEQTSKKK